jgi:hypothetical protein
MPGKVLSTATNKANVNAPPNKIPRLANATSVCVPQKVANLPATGPAPRRTVRPASPSLSRLPTLVPKRPRHGHHPSVSNLGDVTGQRHRVDEEWCEWRSSINDASSISMSIYKIIYCCCTLKWGKELTQIDSNFKCSVLNHYGEAV